jgi:hypothetical protein
VKRKACEESIETPTIILYPFFSITLSDRCYVLSDCVILHLRIASSFFFLYHPPFFIPHALHSCNSDLTFIETSFLAHHSLLHLSKVWNTVTGIIPSWNFKSNMRYRYYIFHSESNTTVSMVTCHVDECSVAGTVKYCSCRQWSQYLELRFRVPFKYRTCDRASPDLHSLSLREAKTWQSEKLLT